MQEAPSEKNLTSPSKKRFVNSSPSRLSTQGRPSKIPSFPAKQMAGSPTGKKNNATPKTKNSEAELVDKRRSTTKSLHMSISFTSHASETSKRTSPVLEKIKNLRVHKTALKSPTSLPTATRVCSFLSCFYLFFIHNIVCPSLPTNINRWHACSHIVHTSNGTFICQLQASVNGVLTETSVNPWSKDRR